MENPDVLTFSPIDHPDERVRRLGFDLSGPNFRAVSGADARPARPPRRPVTCGCGLRLGELAGLRRRRLDLPRQRLRIAEILVEVKGELTCGPPKTNAGTRTVPLPRFIAKALADHLDRYARPDDDALVFAGSEGGALRARAWHQRVWLPAIKEANVAPLRPHDLRHAAVSLWIAASASPKQIAVWAGHTSVSILLDRYGHLFPGNAEPVHERLEAIAAIGEEGHRP